MSAAYLECSLVVFAWLFFDFQFFPKNKATTC